jgi:hypothetical protein
MSGVIDHVNLTAKIDALQLFAADLGVGGYAQLPILLDWSVAIANGTGSGKATQVYQDTGSLAGSASVNIDLAGSLTNAFGATITFTKIKLLAIRAAAANNASNNLLIKRGASNGYVWFTAASDEVYLSAGAFLWHYDPTGVTVTAGTGDIITLTNSAGTNTISYDIVIVGED